LKRIPPVFFLLLVLFLLAAGLFSYSYFLPRYIEKRVFPGLAGLLSSSVTGKVQSIGFNSAILENIVIGDSPNIAGEIGSIHAVYSPLSILAKKLDSITINGLTLNLILTGDKILIPGIDLERFARTKSEMKVQPQTSAISLPIGLDNFRVTNGLLNIHSRNRLVLVPFSLEISRQGKRDSSGMPVYLLTMLIVPQGSVTTITGTLDLASNSGDIVFGADSFDLTSIGALFGNMPNTLQFGPLLFSGKAKFKIMPLQLESAEIDGGFQSLYLPGVPVRFAPSGENGGKNAPLSLQVRGEGEKWDVAVQGAITEPLSGMLDLYGSLTQDGESVSGSGKILFRLIDAYPSKNREQIFSMIKGKPAFTGNFSLDMTSSGTWQAKLESSDKDTQDAKTESFQIQYGGNIFKTRLPVIAIQGKGSSGSHEIYASFDLADVHLSRDDTTEFKTPQARFLVSLALESQSGQESHASGTFDALLADTQFRENGVKGKADFRLQGSMGMQDIMNMKSLQATGNLSVQNGSLEEQANSLKVGLLDTQIPWHWPLSGQEMTGEIKAGQISWKKNELGTLDAVIKLNNETYTIECRYTNSLVPGIVTALSGNAVISDSGFQANLSLHTPPTPFTSLHLGRIDPVLNNSYLAGELGLDGSFRLDAKGLQGGLTVKLQNGRFEYPEKKYEVNGITFTLQLPYLPELRSTPAQHILFEKASVGNLLFEKGKIIWQLESADTFFIEEGVVGWSGGRVFTNAVRISPDMKEFVVTIFCDRLILAEILRQFGITTAEGEGTVSGRLPLLLGKGSIRFEDGFLYSSPGQGGSVKVAALDLLSAGIPSNTPQFAQVDFAAEALKNFKYEWVKLILNSEGNDLIMQMQMDGKPMQSLPFTYDTQTGLLQRAEGGSKGIDQPIRLDVNFRLPLNRFLGYSGKIQDIMEKIK
jgi:hypothetical protein